MSNYNPEPTRSEYNELKRLDLGTSKLTWDEYLAFKSWERTHYNHNANMAFSGLLNELGVEKFTFGKCLKCGDLYIDATGRAGYLRICLCCGYICIVDGNRYNYIEWIPERTNSVEYEVATDGTVTIRGVE